MRQRCRTSRIGVSVVAVRPFHSLVPLLRLDAEGSDGPRFEAADTDRFVCLLTIAVGAVVDAMERRLDLGDQPAFAGPGAKLDRALCLERGSVGQVGFEATFLL